MPSLLSRVEQFLMMQGFTAHKRQKPLNGDGFRVSWHIYEINPTPCIFTSTTPVQSWICKSLQSISLLSNQK